ncbi:unnamed protein product [Penicillium glandicola]
MPSQFTIQAIRNAIGYQNLSERGILEALTAAGADSNNFDGNKRLAQMGVSLIEYHIIEMGYRTGFNRGKVDQIRSTLTTADYRALVAKHNGIDQHIKYGTSGSRAASVLAQAVSALLAILHLEAKDPDISREGMLHLGFLSIGEYNAVHSEFLSQHSALVQLQQLAQSPSPETLGFDVTYLNPISPSELPFLASLPLLSNDHPVRTSHTRIDELVDASLELENLNPSSTHAKRNIETVEQAEQPIKKRQEIGEYCRASILRDTEKCKAQNLPLPRETFFNSHIVGRVLELNCKFTDTFYTILAQIAGSSSIVTLKEALECSRTWPQIQKWRVSDRATRSESFAIIGELEARDTYCALLKRYHVMELFRNCGGSDSQITTNVVICTGREILQGSGRMGNPGHIDEAKVTDTMMKEVFPNLQPGGRDYETRRRSMSRLRVLGRRLQLFADKFGNSSLAFMQPCKVSGDFEKAISDHMILAPSDVDFKLFLDILDESQGGLLRQFNTAAEKIIRHLIYENRQQHAPFHLENVDSKEIMDHPKGSPGLLRMLN